MSGLYISNIMSNKLYKLAISLSSYVPTFFALSILDIGFCVGNASLTCKPTKTCTNKKFISLY